MKFHAGNLAFEIDFISCARRSWVIISYRFTAVPVQCAGYKFYAIGLPGTGKGSLILKHFPEQTNVSMVENADCAV